MPKRNENSIPIFLVAAILFKKCANIDAYDLEINTEDPKKLVDTITLLASSWGGINLEDIRAPECFFVEEELQKVLDIPVFHDDQHGTAVTLLAALINALDIQGKRLEAIKIVINGAGAAGIACAKLLCMAGASRDLLWMCDSQGVVRSDRADEKSLKNAWKMKFARETSKKNSPRNST